MDYEVTYSNSLPLAATGGSANIIFDEDFARCGHAWFAIADGGVSAISIGEELIASAVN